MPPESSSTVEYLMQGVLLHADKKENLVHVGNLLFRNNANAILIRDAGIPVGIVTAKDILKTLFTNDKDPDKILAHEIMNAPIIAIDHDQEMYVARRLMLEQGVQKLPVRKGSDIIGLVIQTDLIRNLHWREQAD